MRDLVGFASYTASAMGLSVLVVWPEEGPIAALRERLRRRLPKHAGGALDCYLCMGFWCGLLVSPCFWQAYRQPWCWTAPLVAPLAFWTLLREPG